MFDLTPHVPFNDVFEICVKTQTSFKRKSLVFFAYPLPLLLDQIH